MRAWGHPPTACESSHHPRWIQNVLYGQFCHLRRACTRKENYKEQSELLKNKFKEKGYDKTHTEAAYNNYLAFYDNSPDHHQTPFPTSNPDIQQFRFSTQYMSKAFEIQHIFMKNSGTLKEDPILEEMLPERPKHCFEETLGSEEPGGSEQSEKMYQ